jgi:hypothetical protein
MRARSINTLVCAVAAWLLGLPVALAQVVELPGTDSSAPVLHPDGFIVVSSGQGSSGKGALDFYETDGRLRARVKDATTLFRFGFAIPTVLADGSILSADGWEEALIVEAAGAIRKRVPIPRGVTNHVQQLGAGRVLLTVHWSGGARLKAFDEKGVESWYMTYPAVGRPHQLSDGTLLLPEQMDDGRRTRLRRVDAAGKTLAEAVHEGRCAPGYGTADRILVACTNGQHAEYDVRLKLKRELRAPVELDSGYGIAAHGETILVKDYQRLSLFGAGPTPDVIEIAGIQDEVEALPDGRFVVFAKDALVLVGTDHREQSRIRYEDLEARARANRTPGPQRAPALTRRFGWARGGQLVVLDQTGDVLYASPAYVRGWIKGAVWVNPHRLAFTLRQFESESGGQLHNPHARLLFVDVK